MTESPPTPQTYPDLLATLKARIRDARLRAAVTVNRELILLYWEIGRDILLRQSAEGWGTSVIDRLARDLRRDFPEMTGLSPRNLKYMRTFAEAWPDPAIVQQLVAQLPWGHNIRLLEALKSADERRWYAHQAIEHGWSRAVLAHQIEGRLIDRAGKAPTNFAQTLPSLPLSDYHVLLKVQTCGVDIGDRIHDRIHIACSDVAAAPPDPQRTSPTGHPPVLASFRPTCGQGGLARGAPSRSTCRA